MALKSPSKGRFIPEPPSELVIQTERPPQWCHMVDGHFEDAGAWQVIFRTQSWVLSHIKGHHFVNPTSLIQLKKMHHGTILWTTSQHRNLVSPYSLTLCDTYSLNLFMVQKISTHDFQPLNNPLWNSRQEFFEICHWNWHSTIYWKQTVAIFSLSERIVNNTKQSEEIDPASIDIT